MSQQIACQVDCLGEMRLDQPNLKITPVAGLHSRKHVGNDARDLVGTIPPEPYTIGQLQDRTAVLENGRSPAIGVTAASPARACSNDGGSAVILQDRRKLLRC